MASRALACLDSVLHSKPEPITPEEVKTITAHRTRAWTYYYSGVAGGAVATWLATQRLDKALRGTLAFVAGNVCGIWLRTRYCRSSVDHILSLEESRMQREMANIMLKFRQDRPWVQRILSKHFYREEVHVDSSTDKIIFRWRLRNSYVAEETNPKVNRRRLRNSSGESNTRSQISTSYGAEEPVQQVSVTAAADAGMEDPFGLVLGVSESTDDDDPQPTNAPLEPSRRPLESSRRRTRKEKRSRRHRRRDRHQESTRIDI